MADRELLELAAKAMGYETSHPMNADRLALTPPVDALLIRNERGMVHTGWNPLTDSGAALEIAVKLRLAIAHHTNGEAMCMSHDASVCITEPAGENQFATTRRAIVRTAAALASRVHL